MNHVRTAHAYLHVTLVMLTLGSCSKREGSLDRARLDALAAGASQLRAAVDERRGLTLIDYYEGGGVRRFEQLCGRALSAKLPELSAQIIQQRAQWDAFGVECSRAANPTCVWNPGELQPYGTRYVFAESAGVLSLRAIINFESGAMNTREQDRYIADKLAASRDFDCMKR